MADLANLSDRMNDPRRQAALTIDWQDAARTGRISINGEYWAAVEWSEKRQAWCIEDAEGRCLTHKASICGEATSKEAAVALAREMILDGRMPSPQQARIEHRRLRQERKEKRERQPAQIAKRQAQKQASKLLSDMYSSESADKCAPPLVEELGDAFDFSDPDLWKSNSWAMIRPRLILHQRAVVARLEYELCNAIGGKRPFVMYATKEQRLSVMDRRRSEGERIISQLQARLDKAREVLSALEGTNNEKGSRS